ncbi:glycosyltransferase [Methylopila sp. M107]|uniref:glycosyltransferase family 32 protein n=1 Tax=Methylopila sp. M107 TaxID=1101190 RepID=UPI00068830A6|nr:glycosyltransferase [Methylopila sp. M107]
MSEVRANQAADADPLEPIERERSDFVRNMVQRRERTPINPIRGSSPTPKRIVQFWDDLQRLPEDVENCMNSWRQLEQQGFTLEVFDKISAGDFIRSRLGSRYEDAFNECYHPSMMSDYFRYSYVLVEGGFYIDADDVYHGTPIEHLFRDGRLKLQPFCYDIATAKMVAPSIFTEPGSNQAGWIFYFNTTPLIAARNHPIVERALINATVSLEAEKANGLPEVQATTGPGNLTRSVFEVIREGCPLEAVMVAHDWEQTSTSQWPLSYRNDSRNWRLSNQRAYRATPVAGPR